MRTLVRDLSLALREAVLPSLGLHGARAHDADAVAAGGDITFAIDSQAEETLAKFLSERAPDESPPVLLSSNDRVDRMF